MATRLSRRETLKQRETLQRRLIEATISDLAPGDQILVSAYATSGPPYSLYLLSLVAGSLAVLVLVLRTAPLSMGLLAFMLSLFFIVHAAVSKILWTYVAVVLTNRRLILSRAGSIVVRRRAVLLDVRRSRTSVERFRQGWLGVSLILRFDDVVGQAPIRLTFRSPFVIDGKALHVALTDPEVDGSVPDRTGQSPARSRTATRPSILAGFDEILFTPSSSWQHLSSILSNKSGGSYGLSGPRGAGKTWLMTMAQDWARSNHGIGVWFPSPSEYNSTAFLAAISDVVAIAFEKYHDMTTGRVTKTSALRYMRIRFLTLIVIFVSILAILTAILAATRSYLLDFPAAKWVSHYLLTWLDWLNFVLSLLTDPFFIIGAILFFIAVLAASINRRRLRERQTGLGRVRDAAEELRREVRYVTKTSEATEVGAEGGKSGLVARLKRSTARELVERPATLSSLIHNFRAFAESIAQEIRGPLIIAIDELDKMTDAIRVAELLRDIKGIFEIPGVYFLVSISDEAARSLDLGGVRTRNEFNSSFYTVLTLPPLEPYECIDLLHRRYSTLDEITVLSIGVLTAGIPRELVRVADFISSSSPLETKPEEALLAVMKEEVSAFRQDINSSAVLGQDGLAITDEDKLTVYKSLPDSAFSDVASFTSLAQTVLRLWSLPKSSDGWDARAEEWRRLLLRLRVAAMIMNRPSRLKNRYEAIRLRQIVYVAATSAAVAKAMLVDLQIERLLSTMTTLNGLKLNPRQVDLIRIALQYSSNLFTIESYATRHNVSHRTARKDIAPLLQRGVLYHSNHRNGRDASFVISPDAMRAAESPGTQLV